MNLQKTQWYHVSEGTIIRRKTNKTVTFGIKGNQGRIVIYRL